MQGVNVEKVAILLLTIFNSSEIEYLSQTLSYNAHQTQNKLVVELQTVVADKLSTVIILKQQKSNKHLILHLEYPDNNTVALNKIEEA